MRQSIGILALAVLCCGNAVACGGDSTGVTQAQVSGEWTLEITSLEGQIDDVLFHACATTTPSHLSITQTGATFGGTFAGGTLSCNNGSLRVTLDTGSVLDGTVSGDRIAFDAISPGLHFEGSTSHSSMDGVLTIADTATGDSLFGAWSARRTSF